MKHRRHIRINGKLVSSPEFDRKKDAEQWFYEMRRKKQFLRDGLLIIEDKNGLKFIDFAREWLKKRMKAYPISTWQADEQRLRDYILPEFSDHFLANITTGQVRNFLSKISQEGYLKEGFTISPSTRTRVKACLSAIFSDALNEDPPLVSLNPVLGIKFKDRRRGNKKPRFLEDHQTAEKFLQDAREVGWTEFVVACIFLMSGVRKQELIALRWERFNPKHHTLEIAEKYIQANHSLAPGTKRGENVTRLIPISASLIDVLKRHKEQSKFTKPTDFIVARPDGSHYKARQISSMIERVREKTGVDISAHGLRHTFGREFEVNESNTNALKTILGHSSLATTQIYSELSGSRIKPFGEAVTFNVGVKESEK